MGDPSTGLGYGYALYGMSPEQAKKYIVEDSNPTKLATIGLEKAYQNFLDAEPPELNKRRTALKAAEERAASSKTLEDLIASSKASYFVKDYGSQLKLTPGSSLTTTPTPIPTPEEVKEYIKQNNIQTTFYPTRLPKKTTPTPTPTPTPNIKDFETLLANQGPSTPIKYYEDLNKGKGGYAPDPSAIPTNVRLKNPPLASDTQEVNIAAGDKDPFLNKADQLLGDLKASKDAQVAERRRTKRDNTGDLAETTALLENLNFFGDNESSGDPSLIAAEYRPTPSPEPMDRLSPNMRGARNYNRENPGTYNPFLPDNVNRHFMGLPAKGV